MAKILDDIMLLPPVPLSEKPDAACHDPEYVEYDPLGTIRYDAACKTPRGTHAAHRGIMNADARCTLVNEKADSGYERQEAGVTNGKRPEAIQILGEHDARDVSGESRGPRNCIQQEDCRSLRWYHHTT